MTLITLLTDFGLQDEYVGVMKGVIATLAPHIPVVDITHGIDPQDIIQGACILAAAYPYFPVGSVHVAVVDPGVGGNRRSVAVECNGHWFVGPDNGILSVVLRECQTSVSAVYIENRDCFLKTVSHTFHGRDVFAPVAARLAAGFPLEKLGPAVDPDLLKPNTTPPVFSNGTEITGQVIAIDRFGNLLTTISQNIVFERESFRNEMTDIQISLCGQTIKGIVTSYDSVPRHSLLAIIGSRNHLEISVNGGNAQNRLGATKGDAVRVTRSRPKA